ncbi:MAG: hypothetical protein ABSB01_17580 [Streptosporangiaceae bacterium]
MSFPQLAARDLGDKGQGPLCPGAGLLRPWIINIWYPELLGNGRTRLRRLQRKIREHAPATKVLRAPGNHPRHCALDAPPMAAGAALPEARTRAIGR